MNLRTAFRAAPVLSAVPAGPILVAVSGGPDSVALLSLCREESRARGWAVSVAHVQHGLRGRESLKDQEFVKRICRLWKIPCEVRALKVSRDRWSEGRARRLRYRALAEIARRRGAHWIFLAHHADDQAETVLLHLLRGSGVQGLCGMPVLRPLSEITGRPQDADLRVVRPLLSFSKAAILSHLREKQTPFRTDRSNSQIRFRRNWVRRLLLPLLQSVQPRVAERLADLAAILESENDWMEAQVRRMGKRLAPRALSKSGSGPAEGTLQLDFRRFFRYHRALRRRLLHRLRPSLSFGQIARLESSLENRARMENLPSKNGAQLFRRFPKRSSVPWRKIWKIQVPGLTRVPETGWTIRAHYRSLKESRRNGIRAQNGFRRWSACFDPDRVQATPRRPWILRFWKAGDAFQPFGMGGTKKLQDFFVDEKVPRRERRLWPIFEAGGRIRWIAGLRTDESARIDPRSRRILELELVSR